MTVKILTKSQTCEKCGHVITESNVETTCDECGKTVINDNSDSIETTVFYLKDNDDHTKKYDFCSWSCLFNWLRTTYRHKILNDPSFNFITLPYTRVDIMRVADDVEL